MPRFQGHSRVAGTRTGTKLVTICCCQVSHSVKERLSVSYKDNTQKDGIDLLACIHFPNLIFDTKAVHFGAVLNNTVKRVPIAVTNTGKLPVDYSW